MRHSADVGNFGATTRAEKIRGRGRAKRAPDQRYRTTPLRGLFTRYKGGFYHDGRFATLAAVVDHHDQHGSLGLSAAEKADLVEYLKSL